MGSKTKKSLGIDSSIHPPILSLSSCLDSSHWCHFQLRPSQNQSFPSTIAISHVFHIPPSKTLLGQKVAHHRLLVPLRYGKNRVKRADHIVVLKNLHIVAHMW